MPYYIYTSIKYIWGRWIPTKDVYHCLNVSRFSMQIKIKFLIDISKMPLYYSAIEKNEVISFAATRMDLEIITLNEVRQVVTSLLLVSHTVKNLPAVVQETWV